MPPIRRRALGSGAPENNRIAMHDVRKWQIVLQKSFCGMRLKFLEP